MFTTPASTTVATDTPSINAMGRFHHPADLEGAGFFSRYFGAAVALAAFAADQQIVGEGDEARNYYEVVDGLFRSVKFTPDGRRQVIAFYGPGDILGLDSDAVHGATIEAVQAGTLAIVGRARVDALAQADAALAMTLYRNAGKTLHRTVDHMTVIGRSCALERAAWFLLDIATRFGRKQRGAIDCVLAMSRRDIADYLGLTIETISRCFALLKKSGVIALRTARDLNVVRPDLLRQLAAADQDNAYVGRLLS